MDTSPYLYPYLSWILLLKSFPAFTLKNLEDFDLLFQDFNILMGQPTAQSKTTVIAAGCSCVRIALSDC